MINRKIAKASCWSLASESCMLAMFAAVVFCGCSRDSQQEAIARIGKAAKALSGESRPDDVEHDTPNIVAERQRKERIRQNTEWTPENQAQHPIEYCQDQLDTIKKHSAQLDGLQHKLLTAINKAKRQNAEAVARVASLEKFLASAKAAYREATASSSTSVTISGFSLSYDKAKGKIVEASREMKEMKQKIEQRSTQIAILQRKSEEILDGQQKLVTLKTKVQNTIDDLKSRDVFDGEDGILDAINAINDSISAFKTDFEEPSLDIMLQPTGDVTLDDDFDAIMAE